MGFESLRPVSTGETKRMSYKEIIFEPQGKIAILTLNRPEVRNVITEEAMIDEIVDACQRV